jgi:hypothetical protein
MPAKKYGQHATKLRIVNNYTQNDRAVALLFPTCCWAAILLKFLCTMSIIKRLDGMVYNSLLTHASRFYLRERVLRQRLTHAAYCTQETADTSLFY